MQITLRNVLLLICVLASAVFVHAADQPNIVHIMVDDLGWQDVSCDYRDYHKDEARCISDEK